MIQAQSQDPEKVIPLIQGVGDLIFGTSGWCKFNEAGDRAFTNCDIWAFDDSSGKVVTKPHGYYNGVTQKVHWY